MGLFGFGRKGVGQTGFGRKGLQSDQTGAAPPEAPPSGRIFGNRRASAGTSAFDRHFAHAQSHVRDARYPASGCLPALKDLSAEERGELLVDMVGRPGLYDGFLQDKSPQELIAYHTMQAIWQTEIAVRAEHLGPLLTMLTGNKDFRTKTYYEKPLDTLLSLISSAIKQGAYLSSGDCEALAQMASDIRSGRKSYRKADTKKMIARAERIEKLAGVEVSGGDLLMQRCEGADNPWAIVPKERPNAQFWADLFAEVTVALEAIRADTKGSTKPAWMRDATAFAETWPACGDVAPQFGAWNSVDKPFAALSQHNGKRSGFADPQAYRRLPGTIALAEAHSRYNWMSDQIPGLEVLADLENPAWTALVEHLITQRRATKATAAWQKEALALCQPIGLATVEARLHDWLALFHDPLLDMGVFTDVCNGERFASAIDRLEADHPEWPVRHGGQTVALGRAVAMKLASGDGKAICNALHTQLIRLDDHVYKNTRVTNGVLGLTKPQYQRIEGHGSYYTMASAMRVSVENEEFLRGAVWLLPLMPDRARAITALADVAQTAATYMWTGEEGMRSTIVANAAIATLIAMGGAKGGSDIDQAVLRLSKTIDNCTINPPLFKYLNGGG
ncbi:MAG: hypothetical protein B7Y36_08750 [Novosphingobium sp. 28-62-57]|uniref:hypothetical protein n=1 Tax=unclassified Novosphingobium TaxID=2644732 RepID=UPI000BCFFBF4|nr:MULTISPECIES: hypothetical protein [unclassified Novosphingobium]OYW48004.1 MAG: hypothetical protein B7Z36_01835 [Novosphingobium sp. 12-63-9]OYZ10898.1 MAG: hypothetical protein B7Y36_08750 [Novosphingobium sp. 28-62-57]HQS68847.1 hypothetical protein [Novosphingobium sp.]